MAVFRVEKNRNYTVMSNHHLKDKNLSLKSKGLLSVILSLPDEWNYTTRGLAAISKEGVDSIGGALKELEKAGYLVRNRLRDERGRISDTEYIIYEYPQPKSDEDSTDVSGGNADCDSVNNGNTYVDNSQNSVQHTPLPDTPSPYTENPYTVKPHTDEPHTKKPAQLNTNQSNALKELNPYGLNIHQSIPQAQPSYPQSGRHNALSENKKTDRIDGIDKMDSYNIYLEIIKDNIDYEHLCRQHKHHVDEINEIVALMLEVACSTRKTIRIGGDDKPTAVVKSSILKMDFTHIEYVLECLAKNTTDIRNIKSYLLTTIYNAPHTIGSYYKAAVNHDFYGNK